MNTNQILQNPLIKICGIVAILYFAFFDNKKNPSSLGNRLSIENIKKNIETASKKSKYIINNVNAAKKYAKEKELDQEISEKIIVECGDEVIANYSIFKADVNIHTVKNEKFVIGSKNNWLIEKNVIGLKKGDVKYIDLLEDLKTESKNNSELEGGLQYRVTINEVNYNISNIQTSCQ